jgi:hypothetical protein
MIWYAMRAELKGTVKSMLISLAALFLCAAAFLPLLPRELAESGSFPQVDLAAVYEGDSSVVALFVGLVSSVELVNELQLMSREEAEQCLTAGEIDAFVELPTDVIDALVYRGRAVITIHARDALLGSVLYDIANEALDLMNRLQNIALVYNEVARRYYPNQAEFYEAETAFDLSLLQEAMIRSSYLAKQTTADPYALQLTALLLFLPAAVYAAAAACRVARLITGGYERRAAVRGLQKNHLYAARLILGAGFALAAAALLLVFCAVFHLPVNIGLFLLSALMMTVLLQCLCFFIAALTPRTAPKAASLRTLLHCTAFFVFLLFVGGGFYPTHLMPLSFKLFNPAWLAHLLAEWILGGTLATLSCLLCLLPAPFALFFSLRKGKYV